jgi:hypothetical protein
MYHYCRCVGFPKRSTSEETIFPHFLRQTNNNEKDDDDIVEVVARVLFPSAKAKASSSLLSIIILFT